LTIHVEFKWAFKHQQRGCFSCKYDEPSRRWFGDWESF
jgi:hypothetical protein